MQAVPALRAATNQAGLCEACGAGGCLLTAHSTTEENLVPPHPAFGKLEIPTQLLIKSKAFLQNWGQVLSGDFLLQT